jgi:hypothetical protein
MVSVFCFLIKVILALFRLYHMITSVAKHPFTASSVSLAPFGPEVYIKNRAILRAASLKSDELRHHEG